jgi:hypothetical protein
MNGLDKEFNEWWNSDGIAEENSYCEGSPVFWAWEGWQAALKAEREACAQAAEAVVPRHTDCGNKIAAAIRARGNDAA